MTINAVEQPNKTQAYCSAKRAANKISIDKQNYFFAASESVFF